MRSSGLLLTILMVAACTAREARESPARTERGASLDTAHPLPVPPGIVREGPVSVRLLDSATVPNWEDSVLYDDIVVYRVEVRVGHWSDTLERVLDAAVHPFKDSVVSGLMLDRTRNRILFRVHSGGPGVETQQIPKDNDWHFHDVAVAPDGRHVIYLLQVAPGAELPVVRAWGSDTNIWVGPERPNCECDTDPHHAHWVTRDSFEFATRLDQQRWERFSGVVISRRLHIDTLPAGPRWH